MPPQERPGQGRDGFTLIELLIGIAVVALLAAIAVPTYLAFIQRARETLIITYLTELHKGQQAWRLETDAAGFTGDFDELEETGFIPDATNLRRVRSRPARRGGTRMTSSRVVQGYQFDLTATDNPSTDTYTYTVSGYPQNRRRSVRWFYLNQTGLVRADMGRAGPTSPPAS